MSESQMLDALVTISDMVRTKRKYRHMRHEIRWHGMEVVSDVTFAIILDRYGKLDKGVWLVV